MDTLYSDEYKAIIRRLAEAQLKAGLTQVEVAEELHKPQSYVSKIENCH